MYTGYLDDTLLGDVQCTHTYDFLIREYFHFRIVQHYLPCQWGSLRHCHLGGCRLNIRCTYLRTNKSIWRQPLLQRGCFIVLTCVYIEQHSLQSIMLAISPPTRSRRNLVLFSPNEYSTCIPFLTRGSRGRDRMVVGFTTSLGKITPPRMNNYDVHRKCRQ
jgi:hypothetical protein